MSDKGIRPAAKAQFLVNLKARTPTTDRKENAKFRATLVTHLMEEYGITLASAATHYNEAFKAARAAALLNTEIASQLEGLGRPEDKKGGRKKKAVAPVAPVESTEQDGAATSDVTESALLGHSTEDTQELAASDVAPVESIIPDVQAEAEVKLYRVVKAGDGSEVAKDLTLEDAEAMVATAASKKKAKLKVAE